MEKNRDYRLFLKEKLSERVQTNSSYSLRAFARDLDVSASQLSQILQGKQGLSEKKAELISKRLNLSKTEAELFCDLVMATDSRSKEKRKIASLRLERFNSKTIDRHRLEMDSFKIISDWYHFAILELTTLKSFKNDPNWVAKKLNISKFEVEVAIERLLRLELLKEIDGKLIQTEENLMTTDGVPSDAIKKYHAQIIHKASQALYSQTVDERSISALTLGINSDDLPEVMADITKLRRKFNDKIKKNPKHADPDQVYCLSMQFFRLTEKGDRDVSH